MTEHKFCKDTSVDCRFHKKGHPCNECLDITGATNFLLKTIKPTSGTLKTGVMNNDYAAKLMEEYASLKVKEAEEKMYSQKDILNFAIQMRDDGAEIFNNETLELYVNDHISNYKNK